MGSLIGARRRSYLPGENGESRVDYISDRLGLSRSDVIASLNQLRSIGLLASTKDLIVYISQDDKESRSRMLLQSFSDLEHFMLQEITEDTATYSIKDLNERAEIHGCKYSSVAKIKAILRYWQISKQVMYQFCDRPQNQIFVMKCLRPVDELREKQELRKELAGFIIEYLYKLAGERKDSPPQAADITVDFSVHELLRQYQESPRLVHQDYAIRDIENALLYMSGIEAIKIEGGFLVIYNPMTIQRLVDDPRRRFRKDDYQRLELFYQNKMEQIHIVGEYARIMLIMDQKDLV